MIDVTLDRRALIQRATAMLAATGLAAAPRVVMPTTRAAAAQATPTGEQVLRMAGPGSINTMAVFRFHETLQTMYQHIYLPPFLPQPDGTLAPGLCLDYDLSDDGLVYTLHLDPEATWSDGTPTTAHDLKFTWEHFTNPANGNALQAFLTEPILGYEEVLAGARSDLTGLVVTDDQTLEVTLSRPFTPFIWFISTCLAGVHQQANVLQGEGWDDQPVCVGPYMVESWSRDTNNATFVRNPHWWRGQATVERVEYINVPDINTTLVLWDNDEIDLLRVPNEFPPQIYNSDQQQYIVETPNVGVMFFCFDTTKAPMEDVNVRRALLKATDTQTIVPAIYEGALEGATGLNNPANAGALVREPFFDPEGAKAALAASAYPNPAEMPSVVFAVTSDTYLGRIATAFSQGWQDVLGISASVVPTDPGFDPAEIGAQLFATSDGGLTMDASQNITDVGLSTGYYFQNLIHTVDAEIDGLINRANELPIEQLEERAALYTEAETLLLDRAYFLPVYWLRSRFLVKPWVENAAFSSTITLVSLPEIVISAR